MLLVTVVCSDPACFEEREVAVEDLDAIDDHICSCGYGFVVLAVSELDEPTETGSLVPLPVPHRAPRRRAA
jgi:hypothetical protein